MVAYYFRVNTSNRWFKTNLYVLARMVVTYIRLLRLVRR